MTPATFRCGHPKTPDNTYLRKNRPTGNCRTCQIASATARNKRQNGNPVILAAKRESARRRYAAAKTEPVRQYRTRGSVPLVAPPESSGALPSLLWVGQGICHTQDRIDFFDNQRTMRARAVNMCYDCPVMFECAQYAVDTNQEYGVWGGLTERDRGYTHRRSRS